MQGVRLNSTFSGLPSIPIRRPHPPFINSPFIPKKPNLPLTTRRSTTVVNKITTARAKESPVTTSTPSISKSLPTKNAPVNVPTSNKTDHNSEKELPHRSYGLDLFTAFLPLLAAICFAPIAGTVFWLLHRKCQRDAQRNLMKSFSSKKASIDKSASNETNISSISSELDYNSVLFNQNRAKRALSNRYESGDLNSALNEIPDDAKKWEFPRHHLRFIGILGEGCFGQVWKCEALNIDNTEGAEIVAVKTLKENANEKEKKDLLSELEVMKMLDPHPNVVTLYGCCTDREPIFLIMEYVPFGKLQSYLRESRAERYYGNLHGGSRLTSRDLTSFAYQVAKGMEYLSAKGVSVPGMKSKCLTHRLMTNEIHYR